MSSVISRKKLLIGGIGVFVIIPIVLSIIFAVSSGRDVNLKSDVKPEIEAAIYGSDADKDSLIIREIARNGDWVVVVTISIRASDYGNNSTVILKEDGGKEYKIVYQGTGDGSAYLKNIGAPRQIIQAAFHNDKSSEYTASVANSAESPLKKYPIIRYLPYKPMSNPYTISYDYKDEKDVSSFYISINAIAGHRAGYRNLAIKAIYGLGFDPGDYDIKFEDYTNPFKESVE